MRFNWLAQDSSFSVRILLEPHLDIHRHPSEFAPILFQIKECCEKAVVLGKGSAPAKPPAAGDAAAAKTAAAPAKAGPPAKSAAASKPAAKKVSAVNSSKYLYFFCWSEYSQTVCGSEIFLLY